MAINYLIVSWHQNNQEINGILGIGTDKVFFISHYSFMAAKSNSNSGPGDSHTRLRDTTNPISYFTIIILTIKNMF